MSGGLTGFPCETGRGRCGQREAGQLGPPLPAPGRASFPLMLSYRSHLQWFNSTMTLIT